MRLEFEYGQGTMAANLPDNTEVFIPGETIPDPPYIPEDELEAKDTGIHKESNGHGTPFQAGKKRR